MGTTTILIVDDEPANLSMLTHLLRPLYQVFTAISGEDALIAARYGEGASSGPLLLDAMTAPAAQYKNRVNP